MLARSEAFGAVLGQLAYLASKAQNVLWSRPMQVSLPATTRSQMRLRARVARGDGFLALRLDGVIDEHCGLAAMSAHLGEGRTLLIDVGAVRRLNSVGVRDWVSWMRELKKRFSELILYDCPPPFMTEVNFVRNFAEGAYIATFGVPLFCARCGKEDVRILDSASLRGDPRPRLPRFPCTHPDCDNSLDDDEDSYLGFLDTQPKVDDPARIARLVSLARVSLDASGVPLGHSGVQLSPPAKPPEPARPAPSPLNPAPSAPAPAASSAPPVEPPAKTPPSALRGSSRDGLFILSVVGLLAVLAVLIYLISTLE